MFCEQCQSFIINLPKLKHIGISDVGGEITHSVLFGFGIGIGIFAITWTLAKLSAARQKAIEA